jgi:hypothetical protein
MFQTEYNKAIPFSISPFFNPGVADKLRNILSIPITFISEFNDDAFYITDIYEIFHDLSGSERHDLLINIVDTIYFCLTRNKPIYIDINRINGRDCLLSSLIQYCHEIPSGGVGEVFSSAIDKGVMFFDKNVFFAVCRQRNLQTLKIGGIYGKACVWHAAMKLADNIFALKDGDFHPNVRLKPRAAILFQRAVIVPKITQYYINLEKKQGTEPRWHMFPGTVCLSGYATDIESDFYLLENPKNCNTEEYKRDIEELCFGNLQNSTEVSVLQREASLF